MPLLDSCGFSEGVGEYDTGLRVGGEDRVAEVAGISGDTTGVGSSEDRNSEGAGEVIENVVE